MTLRRWHPKPSTPTASPLVVYQGGKVDVDRFDNKRTQAEGNLHFFTDSPALASVYAEHGGLPRKAWQIDPDDLMPSLRQLFLSMREPLVADAHGGTKDDVPGYYDMVDSVRMGKLVRDGDIQENGSAVDGLILHNIVDIPNGSDGQTQRRDSGVEGTDAHRTRRAIARKTAPSQPT